MAEAASQTLEDWIVSYWHSAEYRALTGRLVERKRITPADETAMICGLIGRLKPERVLEIGTFFGQTTLAMAEAVSANGLGRLETIDPFGGHRVPEIIAGWAAPARAVTDFKPLYSMEYFAALEDKRETLGLAFVDGNHKFDYALFDLSCAADRLLPGGAIVVDNMELEGPRLAAKMFLSLNPAWKIFANGTVQTADEAQKGLNLVVKEGGSWGVLLAPNACQVSGTGFQRYGATPRNPSISGVRFNLTYVPKPMPVYVNIVHHARAFDFHITGERTIADKRRVSQDVQPGQSVLEYTFAPPIALGLTREDMNFGYLLEISLPQISDYLLLDPATPFELLYTA